MKGKRQGALGVDQSGEYLGGVARRTLTDARWRARHNLPAVRIGKKLAFLIEDLDKILARGREKLPRRDEGGVESER